MKHEKDNTFAGRRETSLNAKKQLLERIKSAPQPDQAELDRKLAEKAAAALAREARQAERQRAKDAEAERLLAEKDASAKAEAEAALNTRAEIAKSTETQAAAVAERKLDRDRRYAARKSRQR
jgi:peptidoglycan hydrolase CwlO-like protein